MVARSIELDGKRKLNLNLLNRGLVVDTIDEDGHVEKSICIEDDALAALITLYESIKNDWQDAYITLDIDDGREGRDQCFSPRIRLGLTSSNDS